MGLLAGDRLALGSSHSNQCRDRATARDRALELAAIAGIALLGLLARLSFGPQVRDDAYITWRYAQNLATGNGFAYNSGEHVLGTTTPLFTLVLAAFAREGVAIPTTALAVGIAADLAVIVLLWRYGRQAIGPTTGLLASLIYALSTPAVTHAVSGMETTTYLLLILLAFQCALLRRATLCALGCGLLTLIRPDGFVVVTVIVLWTLLSEARSNHWPPTVGGWAREGAKLVRGHWSAPLVYGVLVAPWVGFAWRYFGSPIPQSMIGKWHNTVGDQYSSLVNLWSYFTDLDDRWFLPLTAVAVVGLGAHLWPRRWIRPLIAWAGLYAAGFLISNKFLYPLAPNEWYFVPLLLPYSLAVGAGAVMMTRWLARRVRSLPGDLDASAILCGLLVAGYVATSVIRLNREHGVAEKIVGGREALYLQLASRMGAYAVGRDVVAASDIGAFGYAYPGPIFDLGGLVTPETVDRDVAALLQTYRPPWLMSFDPMIPAAVLESDWFDAHYRPVAVLRNWESRRTILFRWYPSPAPTRLTGPTLGGSAILVGRRLWWEGSPIRRVLRVELTWLAAKAPAERITLSAQVLDQNWQKIAQQDNEPQEGTRPTTTWRPGQLIVDKYDLAVPIDQAHHPTWLTIAGYPTENNRASLSWQDVGGGDLGSRLYAPLPLLPGTAIDDRPMASCTLSFVGGIQLAGFSVQPAAEDQGVSLTMRWQASQAISEDYVVFVHGLSASGQIIVQADGRPVDSRLPTVVWEAGDRVVETRLLHGTPTDALARVSVGLYRPADGSRLARTDGRGDSVTLSWTPAASCR